MASQRVGAARRPMTGSAKQSTSPRKKEWIASSRSLSSGAHSRDPLAPLRKRFAFVAGNDGRSIPAPHPALSSLLALRTPERGAPVLGEPPHDPAAAGGLALLAFAIVYPERMLEIAELA